MGRCTGNQACCTSDIDCPASQGCCGNGSLEVGEQCDDRNLIDGDCCSPTCQVESAPCVPLPDACLDLDIQHIINNPKISYAVIKDSPQPDGLLDYWTSRGEFDLPDGIDVDPDTEDVHMIFSGNDGFNLSTELYHPVLEPANCVNNICFKTRPDRRGWERFWKFSLRR
jgi:cysteine-rich repeat protein